MFCRVLNEQLIGEFLISTTENSASFARDWDDASMVYKHMATIYQTTNANNVNENTATNRVVVEVKQLYE